MPELGHMAYYVRNLERSVSFYQKVVGLTVVGRIFNGRAAVLSSGRNHHDLLLIQVSIADGPLTGRRVGLYHAGWKVGHCFNDLQNALDRAQTYNVKIDGTADHGIMFSLYLRDPDDNEVELFVDNPEYDWRIDSSWMEAPVRPLDLSIPYQHRTPPGPNVKIGLRPPQPRPMPIPPVAQTQMQPPLTPAAPPRPMQAPPVVQTQVQPPLTPVAPPRPMPAPPVAQTQMQPPLTPVAPPRPMPAPPVAQTQMQPPLTPVVPPRPMPAPPVAQTQVQPPLTPAVPPRPAPVQTTLQPVAPIPPQMEQDNVPKLDAVANAPTAPSFVQSFFQEPLMQAMQTLDAFIPDAVVANEFFQSEPMPAVVQQNDVNYDNGNYLINPSVTENQDNLAWTETPAPVEMYQHTQSFAA